jgi:hypothetical protein
LMSATIHYSRYTEKLPSGMGTSYTCFLLEE